MKELERQLKALANKRRLAILKYLKGQGQASVGVIAGEINLSFKATSRHLAILTSADIVDKEQKSLLMFYHLSSIQEPITKYLISIL